MCKHSPGDTLYRVNLCFGLFFFTAALRPSRAQPGIMRVSYKQGNLSPFPSLSPTLTYPLTSMTPAMMSSISPTKRQYGYGYGGGYYGARRGGLRGGGIAGVGE